FSGSVVVLCFAYPRADTEAQFEVQSEQRSIAMWSSRLYTSLFLLVLLCLITPAARAFDDEADEYDVNARVVRISLISGEVNLKRKGNSDWERARLNYPLVEGDTVATDRESRVEIQFDARNFVRLAP